MGRCDDLLMEDRRCLLVIHKLQRRHRIAGTIWNNYYEIKHYPFALNNIDKRGGEKRRLRQCSFIVLATIILQ